MQLNYEKYAELVIGGLCLKSSPTVTRIVDDKGVLLSISNIEKSDMGMIIGRNGEHIKAIRTLLRAVGKTENAHVSIRVEEPMDPVLRAKAELEQNIS
jgi:predicted RNA-binding protein YlqC (UPF0109 family)